MNTNNTLTQALREAADLLAAHPDLPKPYVTSRPNRIDLNWYLHGRDDLATQKATAVAIVKALDGTWAKTPDVLGFSFTQSRGLVELYVSVDRPAVCERVVVGTETRTIPAVSAEAERTETVDSVEWVCQPILADHLEQVAEQVTV